MSQEGVDTRRRRFLTAATTVVGAVGAGFVAVPFVVSWTPSARARAIGAPVEVDISKLEPGQMVVQTWRGKPVWVVRRSEDALNVLRKAQSRASENPWVRYHIALALSELGREAEARTVLQALFSAGVPFDAETDARALLGRLGDG